MNYLANAFSLSMVSTIIKSNIMDGAIMRMKLVDSSEVPHDISSAVGHADTAAVLTAILGFEVPCNRMSITLTEDDKLYVAQLEGGRLPEGCTTLPEGCGFTFYKISVEFQK